MKIKKSRTIVSGRAMRDLLIVSTLAAVVGLAACDTGPTAPTSLTGTGTGTQQTALFSRRAPLGHQMRHSGPLNRCRHSAEYKSSSRS